jgi:hypothetical protein
MCRIAAWIVILSMAWLLPCAQQTLPNFSNTVPVLHGRIVLYDWLAHETTNGDDFVVKTDIPKEPYVRVIYKPFWGFDAPAAEPKDKLARIAFIGRGARWNFAMHEPQSLEEKTGCSMVIVNHQYEDERGSGEIPRFIPTPGSDVEKLPSPQSLPCYILKHNGLTLEPGTGTLKSAAGGKIDF